MLRKLSVNETADVRAARLLSALPMFDRWEPRPLPMGLVRMVDALDEQALMTLTVHALRRLSLQHETVG